MSERDPLTGATAVSADDAVPADYGSPSRVLVRLIRECVLPNWKILVVSVTAMTFTAATAGALPFLLQRVADDIFVAKDPTVLFVLPGLVLALMLVRAV